MLLNHRVCTECEALVGRKMFRVLAGAALAAEVRSAARRSVRVCDLHDSQAMVVTLDLARGNWVGQGDWGEYGRREREL